MFVLMGLLQQASGFSSETLSLQDLRMRGIAVLIYSLSAET